MWNVVQELLVTLEDIKWNAIKDKFIKETKRTLRSTKGNTNRFGAKRKQDVNLYMVHHLWRRDNSNTGNTTNVD